MEDAIRDSYDAAAEAYADHLFHELDQKPLDRHLLNRFAEAVRGRGLIADLGCGPGHVARYLHDQGAQVAGVDLSPGMIRTAIVRNPGLDFRVGDMTQLDFADASLAGAIAFYSIVHTDPAALGVAFREMRRVVRGEGIVLIAFHIGDESVTVDDLFGAPVALTFRFHGPENVIRALEDARFKVIERVEREPYEGAEYPSRRCYLLAKAIESAESPRG